MQTQHWTAVSVTAVAIFVLVTSEMLPVGLLTAIARDLDVSNGTAGTTLTAPGLVAAVAAPVLPIAAWRVDRGRLLAGLMVLLAVANACCALASSFAALFASRVLAGAAIGCCWAMAAGIGGRLVRGPDSARATSIIFGGVSVATVVGVPAGSLIGDAWGWRAAFAVAAAVALLLALVMARVMPPLPGSRAASFAALGATMRNRGVRAGLSITALVVLGHFAAYTFVSPVLRASAGIVESELGPLLLGYGIAGAAGNFIAGALLARDVRRVMQGVALAVAVSLLGLPWLATTHASAMCMMALWGLSYGAVGVTVQGWVSHAAGDALEPATALSASVFNLAIAAGSFAGGVVVDQLGALRVMTFGGALAALAVVAAQLARSQAAR